MSKFAISNIAWLPRERTAIYRIMKDLEVRGLEIAPSLVFQNEDNAFNPSSSAIDAFIREMSDFDLAPVSMQSLLFGVADAQLFGSAAQREKFELGLNRAIDLAGRLRIPNLVFGSPKNRTIPDGMSRVEARAIAIAVFRRLGDRCLALETRLAIEPNPMEYGTNFLNSIGEVLEFVAETDNAGLSANFDLGALQMTGDSERVADLFQRGHHLISHVHISEPHLARPPRDPVWLEKAIQSMRSQGYSGWISLEMNKIGEDNIEHVKASLIACKEVIDRAELA